MHTLKPGIRCAVAFRIVLSAILLFNALTPTIALASSTTGTQVEDTLEVDPSAIENAPANTEKNQEPARMGCIMSPTRITPRLAISRVKQV
jgi:membrane protein involved in colicin uptake